MKSLKERKAERDERKDIEDQERDRVNPIVEQYAKADTAEIDPERGTNKSAPEKPKAKKEPVAAGETGQIGGSWTPGT